MSRSSAAKSEHTVSSERAAGPREIVYDEEVHPLVSDLIDKCVELGIPIVIGVELDNVEDGSGQTVCVSYYSDDTNEPSSGVVDQAVELFSAEESE